MPHNLPIRLPIYVLGRTYVLHTRINGRQFKRSLKTADPRLAKLRAVQLLGAAYMSVFPRFSKPSGSIPDHEWRRFEMDAKTGVFKTDGTPEDHERMMRTFEAWKAWKEVEAIGPIPGGFAVPSQQPPAAAIAAASDAIPDPHYIGAGEDSVCKAKGPAYSVVFADFVKLKPKLSKGTTRDYGDTVSEFETFAGKPTISQISEKTITDYMRWLAVKGNTEPTIDKKIGALRALFNFGKKQKIVTGENFAADRNLQTRAEKNAGGHKFYELDEVKEVMGCQQFQQLAQTEPGFYLVVVGALISGIRITALATLQAKHFRKTVEGRPYISVEQDKTDAGTRKVPMPDALWQQMKDHLEQHGGFGFEVREDGAGASDPVRKILNVHLQAIGAKDRGFTVHGLRKTLNQCLIDDEVHFEERCQFLGHEIDHVNLSVYGKGARKEKKSIDKIAQIVRPTQDRLLRLIGYVGPVTEAPSTQPAEGTRD
jgi:integrase